MTAQSEFPDLSIVIVSWNTRDLLRDCLASIHDGLGPLAAETIVVDNASRDGTAAMCAEEFPEVRLIQAGENLGYACGNNLGLQAARGRFVLLLNPDTVILDDVLERALAWADARPDVGVVGCQVLQDESTVQRTCFRFPSPLNTLLWLTGLAGRFPLSRYAGRAAYGPWRRDSEREVDVVSGMFMLVRREAIDRVGLMDGGYFLFAEEADWCRRFWDAGWRCVFTPAAGRILHVDGGSKSTAQARVRMHVELQKSILRYHRKHRGPLAAASAKALFCAATALRAAWWRFQVSRGRDVLPRFLESIAAARYHWLGEEPAR